METQRKTTWVYCPVCGQKTRVKVTEDTVLIRFPLFCPKCKEEHLVNIIHRDVVVLD